MAIPLVVNGQTFEYPVDFDENWGINATGWAQAVTVGMLQRAGGNFPLTADANFGASFGLIAPYFTSHATNPATVGTLRLASADPGIAFRNNANSGNLVLTTNALDDLIYPKGIELSGNLMLNNAGAVIFEDIGNLHHIFMESPSTTTNYNFILPPNGGTVGQFLQTDGTGTTTWVNAAGGGTINNGSQYQLAYYATTGTTLSGLTLITPSRALISDANGLPIASTVTSSTLGFLDATSSVQTQINATVTVANAALPKAGGTMSGVIAMGANKITGIANGTAAQDATALNQLTVNFQRSDSGSSTFVTPTTLTTKAITTTGGAVLVLANADLTLSTGSTGSLYVDSTGGTPTGNYRTLINSTASSIQMSGGIATILPVAAGTYTFTFYFKQNAGTVTSPGIYSLVLIELHS
jgi:hypothetical protein